MNDNLAIVKIFLFAAAVLSALAAVYSGVIHQILGFSASGVCFISFLILVFYKQADDAGEYDGYGHSHKKYKTYKRDLPPDPTPYVPAQEVKHEPVTQFKAINIGGNFQRKQEGNFSKEEIINEKIKILNKFASVASHDLKNPLSSMKNIAYYFSNSVKIEGEVPNKMLKMLSSEVNRMNNMIVELLDSTRVKQLNKGNNDLKALINEVIEKYKEDKYSFDTSIQELYIYADPERIKQVLSSIIQNAKEAMPDGGTMSVKAYKSANEAFVEISDTGIGMDNDTLAQCFDPMFSTKQAKALGMSLTVSKQIVAMHGGAIKAESSSGKGSKFIINLPLAV
ncbi:MAG: HAMP domain-containing histidine kinase [Endomicrobia bacterium]|nr:HAMP domain-containing histidine kinase [Endomicrobiia bacterium]MCL2144853.1 HAMP domain-containing histidine kinase [Endomicrobiia bacterium]